MSAATATLHKLAAQLGARAKKFPGMRLPMAAESLVRQLTTDEIDIVGAEVKLSEELFRREATPETLNLHNAVIEAVKRHHWQKQEKDRRHGISRSNIR